MRDVDLGGAHQRHIPHAELAGGQRRELRHQVRSGREQNADHVVVVEIVALQHRGDQLTGGLEHLLPVVGLDLRRAPDGSDGHALSFSVVRRPDHGALSSLVKGPSCPLRSQDRGGPLQEGRGGEGRFQRPTSSCRAPSSSLDSFRIEPDRIRWSWMGPTAVRVRRDTGSPTWASSRRTMCLRPSCRTTSTTDCPAWVSTTRNESTLTGPSSSSTPPRSRRARSPGTEPDTWARYVLRASSEGGASRWASSPSLVRSSRPSVSWSSRPTWTSPLARSPTMSPTVGRARSSLIAVITPAGLFNA